MLTGLWKWTIVSGDYENSTIDLCSTGNHVLDVVGVAWHINVCVVTLFGFVFLVGSSDGNTTSLLLRCVIDLVVSDLLVDVRWKTLCKNGRDSCSQSGFTVVDVAHGTDVDVRLATVKFCHSLYFSFIFNNFWALILNQPK